MSKGDRGNTPGRQESRSRGASSSGNRDGAPAVDLAPGEEPTRDEALRQVEEGRAEIVRLRSELRLSAAALVTSQEMERKRMASELHDSIGQSLNALSFGIRLAIDQLRKGTINDAEATLDSLAGQVRETIEEARRIALDLRPAMLDDLGVIGTLSWFFRQVRTLHPRLEVRVRIEAEEREVPDTLRTPIYRVVQEAVSNIVKHSGATEVAVALHAMPTQVEVTIEDNGSGFTVPPDFSHLGAMHASCGLVGMRNRVEFSGGKFSLSSRRDKGTSIKAVWPLRLDSAEQTNT